MARKEVPAPPKPTVGRVVHYVQPATGVHLAAIIAGVDRNGNLNLAIFTEAGQHRAAVGILEDQTTKMQHTWHWPERE